MNGGRQQYRGGACRRRYVPERKERGYPDSLREQAAALRAEGQTLVQIAETLSVTPRTLHNWFRAGEAQASPADVSESEPGSHASGPDSVSDGTEPAASQSADDIASEAIPASKRATIHDVAERAGVAASTVSNYLNDKGRMNASTRERVQEAIDALRFTPNALTRAIRKGRTQILGVVVDFGLWDLDDGPSLSIIPPLLAGINKSAEAAGNDVLLYTSGATSEAHGGLRFLNGHIDGLLFIGSTLPKPILERTAAAGLPIVAMLTRDVPANVGYVNVDNIAAMHAVVEHLVSVGRRRIGYFGSLHDSNHIDRYQGFCDAMEAAGLAWDSSPMEYATLPGEAMDPDRFGRGIKRLMEMTEQPDAIVVPNDLSAAWTVEELVKHGRRVPEDVAVTGFDDVPEAAHIAGGLTTVRQPFRRIGQIAVERLLAKIEGAPTSDCRITLPAELIVRTSTVG
jgi:DNA-binding LacI/PurR family transcriptional regulator/transposase-like protein